MLKLHCIRATRKYLPIVLIICTRKKIINTHANELCIELLKKKLISYKYRYILGSKATKIAIAINMKALKS